MFACLQDPERQKECEELLGPIGDDKFTYLKDVGRLITDFSQPDEEPGAPGDTLDDDIGVAVEFDGDEDADEESEVDEVEVCCLCGQPELDTAHASGRWPVSEQKWQWQIWQMANTHDIVQKDTILCFHCRGVLVAFSWEAGGHLHSYEIGQAASNEAYWKPVQAGYM